MELTNPGSTTAAIGHIAASAEDEAAAAVGIGLRCAFDQVVSIENVAGIAKAMMVLNNRKVPGPPKPADLG
jgi:hypothetical protein